MFFTQSTMWGGRGDEGLGSASEGQAPCTYMGHVSAPGPEPRGVLVTVTIQLGLPLPSANCCICVTAFPLHRCHLFLSLSLLVALQIPDSIWRQWVPVGLLFTCCPASTLCQACSGSWGPLCERGRQAPAHRALARETGRR